MCVQAPILLSDDEQYYVRVNLKVATNNKDREVRNSIVNHIIQMAWKLSEKPDQLEWLYGTLDWDKEQEDDLWYHTFFTYEVDYIINSLEFALEREIEAELSEEHRKDIFNRFSLLKEKLNRKEIEYAKWKANREK